MMIRWVLLGGVLLWTSSVHAQDPVEVFARGNQFYQGNRFAEARDAYESILRNGYEAGEIYYNLGNAYYRLGNVARSILCYERGLRLLPNDEDLQHNLQLASLMTVDRIESTPRLAIWNYWDELKGAFSASSILWTTSASFTLVVLLLGVLIVGRSYPIRRVAFISAAASIALFLFLLVLCINRLSDLSRDDYAIVTSDLITIKNSPDAKSTDAFVLHSGVKVQITDRVSTWLKIRIADGKVGWMEKGAAEVI